jgi:site-specific DNA recombinase
MKQAAMYVRVSTNQQKEDATIESQKSLLLQFAAERGYEIPPRLIFEDNGVSGGLLARPALDKLRDFASEGIFDCIFVLSPDRLSRKYAYQVILVEEFKKNDVYVYFKSSPASNSPGETLLEQMQGMFAEYERAQIAERTRRGKVHKAKNGSVSVLSKAPYGYRYISATSALPAYFEIVDREAQVVRLIFDLYVKERLSAWGIRDYLYKHQIPSPKGNSKWGTSSIIDLLKNSAYRGIAYFGVRGKAEPDQMRLPNRRVRINGRKSPRRGSMERPPSEWIPIPVPSIIANEIFELAQGLRDSNKRLSKRNTKSGTLLQGLISCKECGYGCTAQISGKKALGNGYYRCNNPEKKNCKNRGIRIEPLDNAVWSSLIASLDSPELIQKEVSKRLSELKNEPIMEKQRQLQKKIATLEQESNRLLDAYQGGCIELSELKTRMHSIKRETNIAKNEIAKGGSGLNQEQLMELNDAVKYFSERLKISQGNLSLEEKRKVLRILVKEIQIGKSDITINHILPLSQNVSLDKNACLHTYGSNVERAFVRFV